jgi:uncharacterized protein YndB with AHSA1/START domain
MTRAHLQPPDPRLDLVLERIVDVPRELVWKAWTQPAHVMKWFAPRPWTIADCEIDLRPGGIFRFVVRSPEGQEFPYVCCYLEVVPNERVIWTGALLPGFRPAQAGGDGPVFTAVVALEPHGKGTKYTAMALHRDEAERKAHEDMGFHEGWGTVLDQLVEFAKGLA